MDKKTLQTISGSLEYTNGELEKLRRLVTAQNEAIQSQGRKIIALEKLIMGLATHGNNDRLADEGN